MQRVLVVVGTRPEAIKLAPLILGLGKSSSFETKVCITGQHRQMLDQVLELFEIHPEFDLDLMRPGQDLTDVTVGVLANIRPVIREFNPEWVVVQGDTTTTFAASLAAFYQRKKVAHIEAGLRTGNLFSPWPEELNRRITSLVTTVHFAPTQRAADCLIREGVAPSSVMVSGNTVIDALLQVVRRIQDDESLREKLTARFSFLSAKRRLILVTAHRRESFGEGFQSICRALATLSNRMDVEIAFPVHPNPNVRGPVESQLSNRPRVHLLEPLDYLPFVFLMTQASLIITDSGGVQEEAPSLGKPVLVMRDTTERPEALDAGTVRLVGTDSSRIVSEANLLLDDPATYSAMARALNPYGDGLATARIIDRLLKDTHDATTI